MEDESQNDVQDKDQRSNFQEEKQYLSERREMPGTDPPDSSMNRHELTVQHINYILARTLLHFIILRMSSMYNIF